MTAVARGSFRNKVSANSAQQRNKTASYGHLMVPRGIPIFKEEPDSRVSLDILPYVVTDANHPDRDSEMEIAIKGSFWYRRPYKLHRNIGAEKTSVVCPSSVGKPCPVCEYRAKLLNEGANWQDDSVKILRASNRDLYYVQPKNEKKLDDKPHLWDVSQFAFQDKLNNELQENDDYSAFPDLDDGMTLRIRFSREKIGTNDFAETSRIDFDTRNYTYDEDEIRELPSLDEVLLVKSYKDIDRMFYETGDEPEEEGAQQDEPKPRDRDAGSRPSTRPKSEARERPSDPEQEPEPEAAEEKKPSGFTRGKKADPEPEREEPRKPAAAKPAASAKPADEREARRAARAAREKPEDECPHGYVFGKDCDKHEECTDCQVWGKCMDELDRLQAA